ncbi:hypothetical protein [Pseudoalteromonas aurantia]|uniref:Uncharacterized protein n=1 Tax=Pseudoalteromonas aurantia 208 TaxID=1314867 RepID=A0ABR9EH21_9GAMM|nr:hypothetical protein [Pseudoalteromonas aurantia]MBE0370285.1 hypothetical protein [Pseudoalteromonas aurantia 208]
MKATPRVRKIALLDKFAYPELRLTNELHVYTTQWINNKRWDYMASQFIYDTEYTLVVIGTNREVS